MSGAACVESRVSIPSSFRKMIQNIKEIAGNHSDEEVYATLKECGMDPNETVQKLLFQDTFHVVKGKRYKRKENVGSKELSDAGWRAVQGRGGRGNRGSYSARFVSSDTSGAKSLAVGKEIGISQGAEKGSKVTVTVQDAENKELCSKSRSASGMANGDVNLPCIEEDYSAGPSQSEISSTPCANMNSGPSILVNDVVGKTALPVKQSSALVEPVAELVVPSSASYLVSLNSYSNDFQLAADASKCDADNQKKDAELNVQVVSGQLADVEPISALDETAASDMGASHFQGKLASKTQKLEISQPSEVSQVAVVSSSSSESRPSSSNRSQAVIGHHKVGLSKEWKPKQQKNESVKGFHSAAASETSAALVAEVGCQSLSPIISKDLEDTTSKVQKKMGELTFTDRGHVIFPNHIRVPESERAGLSFGSFDASYGQKPCLENEDVGAKVSTSDFIPDIVETDKDTPMSHETVSAEVEEETRSDCAQSPLHISEGLSAEDVDASLGGSVEKEYDPSKPGTIPVPGAAASQYSTVQTSPTYSTFGLIAPVFAGQIASIENTESQTRDASQLPGIVVQQPFDMSSSFYTQMYRGNVDGDGHTSPVVAPASTVKYNGHPTVLSSQTDQITQENQSGNSPGLPASGPASVNNHGAGVMQNSVTVQQHPVSVFRQPSGLHISHYPHNFIPYSQYFSPFYLPPNVHPFLSNPTFPQQHPTGNIYPPPMVPPAAPVKFSLSHFKAGGNSANSAHVGSTTGFGPYSSSLGNYSLTPVTGVNSAGNEDLTASQYKENSIYLAGQQSEGPTVWIPAPGRDMPGLQANSFYNIAPQGQPVAFTPVQGGHAAFPGIYHPSQTGAAATVHPLLQQSQAVAAAVEMVAPPTGVYQQPQRTQINWANNY